MSNLEEKLTRFQTKLATVKASPRYMLAATIPGVREGVELVTEAEHLLVAVVRELQQLRAERAKE